MTSQRTGALLLVMAVAAGTVPAAGTAAGHAVEAQPCAVTFTLPAGTWAQPLRQAALWWNAALLGTGIHVMPVSGEARSRAVALPDAEFQQDAPGPQALGYAWPATAQRPGGIVLPRDPDPRADPVDVAAHEIGHLLWLSHGPAPSGPAVPAGAAGTARRPVPGIAGGDQWRAWQQRTRIASSYCPGVRIGEPAGPVPVRYRQGSRVRIVDWSAGSPLSGYAQATLLLREAGAPRRPAHLAAARLRGRSRVLPTGRLAAMVAAQCREQGSRLPCPSHAVPTLALAVAESTWHPAGHWTRLTRLTR